MTVSGEIIVLPPVEPEQMDNVSDWEMARALYADTFQYPIDKAAEWTKLIEGPNWVQAEGFKRMARRCREALEARNLQIVNKTQPIESELVAKLEALREQATNELHLSLSSTEVCAVRKWLSKAIVLASRGKEASNG